MTVGDPVLIYKMQSDGKSVPAGDEYPLDVLLSDQSTRVMSNHFSMIDSGPWSLNSDWLTDSYEIEILNPPAHGIIAGDSIYVYDTFGLEELTVLSVAADAGFDKLTLDTPAPKDFLLGNTEIYKVSFGMNVNGAVTRQAFRFPADVASLPEGIAIDVTQIRVTMITATEPDDSQFGDIVGGLTRGIVARHHRQDGINQLGNFKINLAMATFGTLEYTDKAGGGAFGVRAVFRFGGQQNAGVVLRIEPGDYLEIIVQDDLSSISLFHCVVIGHLTT